MNGSGIGGLLSVDDSVVCVIDVQPGFLDKLGPGPEREPFVQRVIWIAPLARALTVPIVVTEEEPDRNGPTLPEVLAQIPEAAPRHTKPTFGLADFPEILASVEGTGRRTAVLVGMETDVCVAHSALGVLDRGYRVAVVRVKILSARSIPLPTREKAEAYTSNPFSLDVPLPMVRPPTLLAGSQWA